MGIADLFRPKYRHSDVRVRTEAVKALTADDAAIIIQIARTDRDSGVRRIAIEKIDAADVLAEIASAERESSLRDFAGERAARLWVQGACGDDADAAGAALGGIIKLGDQAALVDVAMRAAQPAIRKRAFGELRDSRSLADLAKRDAPQDIRLAAVGRIDDADTLRALATDTTQKEVALAAVEKLDDKDRLEQVAQKAKNKAVRQRARKIVQQIDEAEDKKKPGLPDEVKRRRAEKAQLVRELEAVADSYDFATVAPQVRAMEEAWGKLGEAADDGDERFAKAAERFWRRKDVHDQQARSSQELRVVEREAREEKERVRATVERTPAPAPAPRDEIETKPEPALPRDDDAARAEREAREAAREVKKKEDAERSASIAASLAAMCEDMEKLAESKQGREIDRVLQQAQRAFEQIGKVIGAERDALSDRYTAARGKLVVRAQELREAEDWARFQNVPKAEALIQTAKELAAAPATPDLGNKLRQLQALWKEVGAMPQRRSKELWEQFKGACDQIYEIVKVQRAGEQEKFAEVAKIKEALIAEAEGLADAFDSAVPADSTGSATRGDFAATAEKLKALQASWKESGFLPRKQGDELWKRFRGACDRFFERRKPLLDARHAEEGENLAKKQALIARAQAVADAAPGGGGWGKAIAEVKELQRQWKDIGFVPRRDADAVWTAFRRACDSLFEKRDAARDAEADAHRAERDAVKAELAAVIAGGDDVVSRAVAARAKARELGGLAREIEDMVRHVIATHADAIKGSELDPTALRARRGKLVDKAAELLPKQPEAVAAGAAPADIAAQLQQAMRKNAFGDLRFSGRDPIEVVDELRAQWAEIGPILDDDDRALAAKFEDTCVRVLEAAGGGAKPAREERDDRGDRGDRERGRRRRRRSAEQPITAAPETSAAPIAPVPSSEAITQPAKFEPAAAPAVPAPPVVAEAAPSAEPPQRRKSASTLPPMDELDTAWDLPEDDPTARKDEPAPPSASEMAGDSATGGDGIDEPGWD
ncbi:MAG TPA: DUF349 domain-containing protein [Kofleriaceae bacterium]|nr:DUF349 domain-containing protein [Kofleriaceae bacterium]